MVDSLAALLQYAPLSRTKMWPLEGYHCGNGCFYAKGAAALKWHHHMGFVSVNNVQQAFANPCGHGNELTVP